MATATATTAAAVDRPRLLIPGASATTCISSSNPRSGGSDGSGMVKDAFGGVMLTGNAGLSGDTSSEQPTARHGLRAEPPDGIMSEQEQNIGAAAAADDAALFDHPAPVRTGQVAGARAAPGSMHLAVHS